MELSNWLADDWLSGSKKYKQFGQLVVQILQNDQYYIFVCRYNFIPHLKTVILKIDWIYTYFVNIDACIKIQEFINHINITLIIVANIESYTTIHISAEIMFWFV